MSMSENEKQVIIENAKFLEDKGCVKNVEESSITYFLDGIEIM